MRIIIKKVVKEIPEEYATPNKLDDKKLYFLVIKHNVMNKVFKLSLIYDDIFGFVPLFGNLSTAPYFKDHGAKNTILKAINLGFDVYEIEPELSEFTRFIIEVT